MLVGFRGQVDMSDLRPNPWLLLTSCRRHFGHYKLQVVAGDPKENGYLYRALLIRMLLRIVWNLTLRDVCQVLNVTSVRTFWRWDIEIHNINVFIYIIVAISSFNYHQQFCLITYFYHNISRVQRLQSKMLLSHIIL